MGICINCRCDLSAHTNIIDREAMPTPGDVAVCLYCGHIMIWEEDMELREPTDEEAFSMAGDPDLVNAMRLVRYWEKR